MRPPAQASPAIIRSLPPQLHVPYINAFVDALSPIFVVAAVLSLVAFGLTWLLREIPLRQTAQSEGVGEAFASPRDDDSYRELERALTVLARREEHWGIYERLAQRSGVALDPPELWLFSRIAEREPLSRAQLDAELAVEHERLAGSLAVLEERGLVADGDWARRAHRPRPGGSRSHRRRPPRAARRAARRLEPGGARRPAPAARSARAGRDELHAGRAAPRLATS